jgi:hypothetical protein
VRQHIRHNALSHQPSQLQRHILRLRGELHALEGANCSSSSEEGSPRKVQSPRARLQSPRTPFISIQEEGSILEEASERFKTRKTLHVLERKEHAMSLAQMERIMMNKSRKLKWDIVQYDIEK